MTAQWGTAGTLPDTGDLNGDTVVDIGDLGILSANWWSAGSGAGGASTAIPTPGALSAALVMLTGWWSARPRPR